MHTKEKRIAFDKHTVQAFYTFGRVSNYEEFASGYDVGHAAMQTENEALKIQVMAYRYSTSASRIAQLEKVNAVLLSALKQLSC